MAAISSFPSSLSCRTCRGSSTLPCFSSFPSLATPPFPSFPSLNLRRTERRKPLPGIGSAVAAVADEETLIPVEAEGKETPPSDEPVSVPVSPSDMLTMLFKAEGMMDESAVPTVSKTLQETEGVSDLKVQIAEGIATVELTKQTTVQATGVASSLVETIQGLGFRLQTLNLSFEDEEDAAK